MTLLEAHDYLDLLIDKFDSAYFTTTEKNVFLELAITEFINTNYSGFGINERTRSTLKGLLNSDTLGGVTSTTAIAGYIEVTEDNIYTLHVDVAYNGQPPVTAKAVKVREYFDNRTDPFHQPSENTPTWSYASTSGDSYIVLNPVNNITYINVTYIGRPDLADAFASTSSDSVFKETHQQEIIQIATRKMSANIESSNYEVQQEEAQKAG